MTNQMFLNERKVLLDQLISEELKNYQNELNANKNRLPEMRISELDEIFYASKNLIVSFINNSYPEALNSKGHIENGTYTISNDSYLHNQLSTIADNRYKEFETIKKDFLKKFLSGYTCD